MTTKFIIRRTALACTIALSFFAGMLNGQSSDAKQGPAAMGSRHAIAHPAGYPPFWGRFANESWCDEDMPCWIGSDQDGRSDKAAMRDWIKQMHIAHDDLATVFVYLTKGRTDGNPLEVEFHSITKVGHCKGKGYDRTCTAQLMGINTRVFVSGTDFPHAR